MTPVFHTVTIIGDNEHDSSLSIRREEWKWHEESVSSLEEGMHRA